MGVNLHGEDRLAGGRVQRFELFGLLGRCPKPLFNGLQKLLLGHRCLRWPLEPESCRKIFSTDAGPK